MTTDQPRVGDTITTVAQLNALPVGTVVVHDSDVDPPGIAVMQRSVHTGAWYLPAAIEPVEPLLPVTVLYVPGEPPSPSVEDARATAERRHTATTEDAAQVIYHSVWTAVSYDADRSIWRRVSDAGAQALLDAGLLATARPATTTEWGVRAWGRDRPCSNEDGARAMAQQHGIPVVRREVTPWIEAGQ